MEPSIVVIPEIKELHYVNTRFYGTYINERVSKRCMCIKNYLVQKKQLWNLREGTICERITQVKE